MSVPRHTAYNIAGSVAPLLVSLITVPLYLNRIGLDRYGVLAICWLVLGYFSFFDFGIGRAAAQRIASMIDRSPEERSQVFWVALQIAALLSLAGMLVFLPLASILLGSIRAPSPELRAEVHDAIPWLVCCVPFGVLNSLLGGALLGRREFLIMNLLSAFGSSVTAVLPLAGAILIAPRLSVLIAAALIGRLVSSLMMLWVCRRAVPMLQPRRARIADVRALLSFGAWITISNLIVPLLMFWDRFVIGAMIGAAAVAIYVVPFNLVWQTILVPNALTGALYPRLAAAELPERRRLISRALSVNSLLMTPGMIFAELAVGPFLRLWIGPARGALAAPIAAVLLFGIWSNSFAVAPAAHIEAQGRPHIIAKFHLFQIIPYGLALFGLVRLLGPLGAALAWALRCASEPLVLFWLDNRQVPPTYALEALLLAAAIGVNLSLPMSSTLHWVALVSLLCAASTLVLIRHRGMAEEQLRAVGTLLWPRRLKTPRQ